MQLDKAARSFCSQEINIADDNAAVRLSKIFEWYRADFGATDAEFRATLAGFVGPDEEDKRRALLDPGCAIEFAAYDWSTNNDSR